MNVGSLFSGIGGIDLGLERAGMRVVWQCEQDAWCRGILARHWPGVPCYEDVRSIVGDADGAPEDAHAAAGTPRDPASEPGSGRVPVRVPRVDVLAGGFPCQPVSLAGKGLAQADERWLWPEFARLVRVLRPRYVIAENVPGLLARGLDLVLADLAALGFDAEWTVFGARDVGAPHRRDRVWIVAYSEGERWERARRSSEEDGRTPTESRGRSCEVAYTDSSRPQGLGREHGLPPRPLWAEPLNGGTWPAEPDVGRVAHGVPARVDRLRALGNAVVPACAEHIGRLVMEMAQ